ncbi:MAG: 30S ribosomal protein S8 [Actinobacteria bacterium]|nr:30S ribosomal protein S8 [Actinomycetota bacterium]
MLTDPIADMLTRIRNANMALHDTVDMPSSRLKADIARVLEEQGYIVGWDTSSDGTRATLTVKLKYDDDRRRVITGLSRVSKPGRRVYADKDSLPKVLGGMGVAIISTSQGLLTGHEARRRGVGGEVLCTVW